MTLQALRNRVGDQAFWKIIRTWIREQRGGNGATAEFEEVAARVSGQDLGSFFTAWLRTPSKPAETADNGLSCAVSSASEVAWFRPPAGDAGTLNACYNALDIHVIRGRAEEVALADAAGDWTFARLLTEVAACAGVLRAFGIGLGDRVALGRLPRVSGIVVALAAARVGAVSVYDDPPAADARMVVGCHRRRRGAGGGRRGAPVGRRPARRAYGPGRLHRRTR